jgi:hypothetical protein
MAQHLKKNVSLQIYFMLSFHRNYMHTTIKQSKSYFVLDWEVAIVKGYPIEGGFAIAFFLCIFT